MVLFVERELLGVFVDAVFAVFHLFGDHVVVVWKEVSAELHGRGDAVGGEPGDQRAESGNE